LLVAERDAQGRFIACNDVQPSFRTLVETMHAVDPRVKLPLMSMPGFVAPLLPLFDRFNHRLLGTPRIATPEVIATSVSGKRWNVSSARAKAILGWVPQISLERSLRETMEVIRAHHRPSGAGAARAA
jgi:nucleoside-diphosphate-sugar epimerase